MANDLPGGPFLPVQTLVLGHREHVEHHKVLHAMFNAFKGGGGSGGGTSRVLARWAWREVVMPARSTLEAVDDDADVGALTFSLIVPPKQGRHVLWDLLLVPAGETVAASIFATPPPPILFDTPNVNGLYTLELDAPFGVVAGDALYGVVTDGGSARWLVMKVLAASSGTPTP